jgi:hypothetical protein
VQVLTVSIFRARQMLQAEARLNNSYKFSSHLTENTWSVHYKSQLITAALGPNWGSRCLLGPGRIGKDLEAPIPEFCRAEKTHGMCESRQDGTSCKLCCKGNLSLVSVQVSFLLSNSSNNEPIRGSETLLRRLELFVTVFTRARHWNLILSQLNPVHTSHSTFQDLFFLNIILPPISRCSRTF